MALCKFWQQGNCRNGDRCRFDHPSSNYGPPNGNRYAALSNESSQRDRHDSGHRDGTSAGSGLPYSIDKAALVVDLSNERPQWILSAYAPGRNTPLQLFGGPSREKSFEEMRLLHYLAASTGNAQQAESEAKGLFEASEQQIQNALANVDAAVNYVIDGDKQHPNRIDICKSSVGTVGGYNENPLNQISKVDTFQASQSSSNVFGRPTVPAFGAPSVPNSSGSFGQPSLLGPKPNPFGAPPQAFGAPSQVGTASAFGRPTTLGHAATPFGASNPLASGNAQAAPFSAFSNNGNVLGQKPSAAVSSSFGAPSQLGISGQPSGQNANAFGASQNQGTFGQPSGQNTNVFRASQNQGIFGQPSGQSTNAFGASQNRGTFGQPSRQNANAFGASQSQGVFGQTSAQTSNNVFGSSAPASNPFSNSNLQPNPFGTSAAQANIPTSSPKLQSNPLALSNPFGSPLHQSSADPLGPINGVASNSDFGQSLTPSTYSSTNPQTKKLTMFKGRTVIYNEQDDPGVQGSDGHWKRIWCPKGCPTGTDTELAEPFYDEKTEAAYLHAYRTGTFRDGVMPMIPPKTVWCQYDF